MTVHVIGAGLAGLSASVRLVSRGCRVVLHEAARQAGGRCRSYHDRALGRVIDNGNHLLLSGNRSTLGYLRTIGAAHSLVGPNDACFPFLDLRSGQRWTLRPNPGRLPVWTLMPSRRVPGSRFTDYLGGWRLAVAAPSLTVADCLGNSGVLWERLWDPLSTAVLNTPSAIGSAGLLWTALRESFLRGGESCRPLMARDSLAASLVEPALAFLTEHRAAIHWGRRLRAVSLRDRATDLHFANLDVALEPGDQVILALPPAQIAGLLPNIRVPLGSHAIVNAHFRLPRPARLPGGAMLLGLVGATAQWLFLRQEVASVTVSAADDLVETSSDEIAETLWRETAKALDLPTVPEPPWRIVKEKRATFSQTPAENAKRPPTETPWPNLHLAGDWTATGLPATIEGAVRSGQRAAGAILTSV